MQCAQISGERVQRHIDCLGMSQALVVIEREIARVTRQPPRRRGERKCVLVERIGRAKACSDHRALRKVSACEQRFAQRELHGRKAWRCCGRTLREGDGARALPELRAEMRSLLQKLNVGRSRTQPGFSRCKRARPVADELESNRAHQVQVNIPRRPAQCRVERAKGRTRVPGAHPAKLREVAMGLGIVRP